MTLQRYLYKSQNKYFSAGIPFKVSIFQDYGTMVKA